MVHLMVEEVGIIINGVVAINGVEVVNGVITEAIGRENGPRLCPRLCLRWNLLFHREYI